MVAGRRLASWPQGGRQRIRGLLERVHWFTERARHQWGQACDQLCQQVSHQRHPPDAAGQLLTTLPRAPCLEPAPAGAKSPSGHGYRSAALVFRSGEGL